jgi:hypothetical protein
MNALTGTQVLALWERCVAASPARRALVLLEAATPGLDPAARKRLPLGRRDRELLRLRACVYGPDLTGLVTCPSCAETVEITADAEAIIASGPDSAGGELSLEHDDYQIGYRLPNSEDLLALAAAPPEPELFLLARCLRWAEHAGAPVAAGELPAEVVALIEAGIVERDPLADIRLACVCPECGTGWSAPLDVVAFLWAEIADYAVRLLHDVHVLATGYGWREPDILALSSERRRAYLNLVS